MSTLSSIERLRAVLERAITQTDGTLDYSRVIRGIATLASAVSDYEGDNDDWLYIGESSGATIDALLVGGYWHLTEWHEGQASTSYAAICTIGRVFEPGMTSGPEPDSCEQYIYSLLEDMASAH